MVWGSALPGSGVGRTWPDVVSDHAGLGMAVTIVVGLLVVVLVGALFVWGAARRARAEGREFSALWGLLAIGPAAEHTSTSHPPAAIISDHPPAGTTPSGSHHSIPPPDVVQRGVLAINRAAHDIAMAPPAQVEDREVYLLLAILKASAQAPGVTRRASILKVQTTPDGDRVMQLHTGTPESLFRHPHARFSKRAHTETGEGLCWAAVHACQGAYENESIRRLIFYAPDVGREPAFVAPLKGHHRFKAILVAPIVHERSREVLGVLCLDSDSTDHYTEVDQHLVAIAALALAVAWKARAQPREAS